MTVQGKDTAGVNLKIRWTELVGFVLFIIMVGPLLFGTGVLWQRVQVIESEVEKGILPAAESRISVIESKLHDMNEKLDFLVREKLATNGGGG